MSQKKVLICRGRQDTITERSGVYGDSMPKAVKNVSERKVKSFALTRTGLGGLFLTALFTVLVLRPLAADEAADSLIRMRMHRDMLYGSDDYFGDNGDLIYSDTVVPSDEEEEETTTTEETTTSSDSRRSRRDRDDEEESADLPDGGPPDDGPPDDGPPDDEPPCDD